MKNTTLNPVGLLDLKSIGRKMHAMAANAIDIIRKHANNPVPVAKHKYGQSPDEEPEDKATQGDFESQDMYRDTIIHDEELKSFGLIGEEGLNLPCTHPELDIYFTCDPLDGTDAYTRMQSNGAGTMLALVINGVIVAAYIGNANTGEIFGYVLSHPTDINYVADVDSANSARTADNAEKPNTRFIIPPTRYRFGDALPLRPNETLPLNKQYLLMKRGPHQMPKIIGEMITTKEALFKDMEVMSGSIGLFVMRLCTGEVGALVTKPSYQTPWDDTPIVGFCQATDCIFFRYNEKSNTFEQYVPNVIKEVTHNPHVQIIVHRSKVPEFLYWLRRHETVKLIKECCLYSSDEPRNDTDSLVVKKDSRLGVDLGRTIIDSDSSDDRAMRKPFDDAFDTLLRLNSGGPHTFNQQAYIVSKVDEPEEAELRSWLFNHNFTFSAGIAMHNVRFCRERKDKAEICKELGITHFIDDRPEVLAHMKNIVPGRILFRPVADDLAKFIDDLQDVFIVHDWKEVQVLLERYDPVRVAAGE